MPAIGFAVLLENHDEKRLHPLSSCFCCRSLAQVTGAGYCQTLRWRWRWIDLLRKSPELTQLCGTERGI